MDQQTTGDIFTAKMKQDIQSKFDISGFALFHQSTLNDFLIEKLTLTAGIRLDMEKDKLDYSLAMKIGGGRCSNDKALRNGASASSALRRAS